MKWIKCTLQKLLPIEVSAATFVDRRDVIISNATVEDIEAGFEKNAIYDSNAKDEKINDYLNVFK